MTLEEKQAIQAVVLRELTDQKETAPTLLLDVLLSGQGHQFVYQVVAKHHGMAQKTLQMTTLLLKAMQPPRDDEAAA